MSKYIEYFNLASDVDGTFVLNIPFSGYVKDEDRAIFSINRGVFINGKVESDYIFEYHALKQSTTLNPFGNNCEIIKHLDLGYDGFVIVTNEPITTIRSFNAEGLKSITLPNSVTSIQKGAFPNCLSLTSIVIPDSVTTIGDHAFNNCSSISSISIGKSVNTIGLLAFSCSSLKSVYWNAIDCGEWLLSTYSPFVSVASKIENFTFGPDVKHITRILCAHMKNLKTIDIPDNVISIGKQAFLNCTGLTTISIGAGTTTIPQNAFNGCTSLNTIHWKAKNCLSTANSEKEALFYNLNANITSFTFGDGVESIPAYLGYKMSLLTSIDLPETVKHIGDHAFELCNNVQTITLYDGVESAGKECFSLPNAYGVTQALIILLSPSIEKYCNSQTNNVLKLSGLWKNQRVVKINNQEITQLNLPDTVTSIPDRAFYNCSSIISAQIPNSVTHVGVEAFEGCSLTEFVYNDHCFAFAPKSVQGVYTIPYGIKQIAGYAFYNCSLLTSVLIPDSVCGEIGDRTFYECTSLSDINIPNNVKKLGEWVFYNCKSLTQIQLSNSLTDISNSAFLHCTSLTSITIPNSVTSIGEMAFRDCYSLTSITIPSGVSSIEGNVFSSCESLTSIVIPDGVTSIGEWAFSRCSSLTSIVIPNSVTSIGNGAFNRCTSLPNITIPASVTSIGSSAFRYCSALASITCLATTPPTLGAENSLTSVTSVYVPAGSVEAYKTATNWSYYASKIQAIP